MLIKMGLTVNDKIVQAGVLEIHTTEIRTREVGLKKTTFPETSTA